MRDAAQLRQKCRQEGRTRRAGRDRGTLRNLDKNAKTKVQIGKQFCYSFSILSFSFFRLRISSATRFSSSAMRLIPTLRFSSSSFAHLLRGFLAPQFSWPLHSFRPSPLRSPQSHAKQIAAVSPPPCGLWRWRTSRPYFPPCFAPAQLPP